MRSSKMRTISIAGWLCLKITATFGFTFFVTTLVFYPAAYFMAWLQDREMPITFLQGTAITWGVGGLFGFFLFIHYVLRTKDEKWSRYRFLSYREKEITFETRSADKMILDFLEKMLRDLGGLEVNIDMDAKVPAVKGYWPRSLRFKDSPIDKSIDLSVKRKREKEVTIAVRISNTRRAKIADLDGSNKRLEAKIIREINRKYL